MPIENATKLSVEIDNKLHGRMLKVVPWGLKRHVISAVLELVVRAAESEGHMILGSIIDGDYKLVRMEKRKR